MGQAMICDRCKEIFDEIWVKRGSLNLFSEEMDITLCNECASELDEWLHPEETKAINKWIKEDKNGKNISRSSKKS